MFSPYLAQKLLGVTLLGTPYTAPTQWYLSLCTSIASGGGSFVEVSNPSYSREVIAFGAPTGKRCTTVNTIDFGTCSTPWGVLTHMAIHDHPTAGNMLYYSSVTLRTLITSTPVYVLPNSITTIMECF